MVLVADIIKSMIQAIIFSYSIECCVKKENKINKRKLTLMSIIIFVICSSCIIIWGNISICVFLIHVASLVAISILYKNDKLRVINTIYINILFYYSICHYSW